MARPRKEIDKNKFEMMCGLQCTEVEICGEFDVCEDTLNSWCKRTYKDKHGKGMCFSEVYKNKRSRGNVSLRRYQWNLAEKNAAVAIWLGKQYLGQKDVVEQVATKEDIEALNALIKAIGNENN